MTEPDTPTRILAAADELFGEIGYDGVSVRDIAERAGVNKALVFYHFGSKDELFARILDRYYTEHQRALERAFEADLPVRERLHRVMDAYIDYISENRHYPRLVQRLVAGSGAHMAPIKDNLGALFQSTVEALEDIAPTAGPYSARPFFVTFSGAVINYFTYAPVLAPVWGGDPLSDEGIDERRAHLHWLVDAMLGGMRPPG